MKKGESASSASSEHRAGFTDVTVEEPRPRVIRLETDDPSSTFDTDDVATRRVEVVGWAAVALDDIEGVAVETIHSAVVRTSL